MFFFCRMPNNTPRSSTAKKQSIKEADMQAFTEWKAPKTPPKLTAEEKALMANIRKMLAKLQVTPKATSSPRSSKRGQRGGNMQDVMNVGNLLQVRDPMTMGAEQSTGMKAALTTPFGAGAATNEPISGENTLLPDLYATAGGAKKRAPKKASKSVKAK